MQHLYFLGVALQVERERGGKTIDELCAQLQAHGAQVSVEIYKEMESMGKLVDDARSFLRAYTTVLQLTEAELHMLLNLWAFAVLTQEMGEKLARESLSRNLFWMDKAS